MSFSPLNTALAFALCAFVAVPELWGQTIETDRPDRTEAATLVPVGGVQIETGLAGYTTANGSWTGYTLPTALLRLGLHERFELRVVGQRDQVQPNLIDIPETWLVESSWDVGAKVAGWNNESSQMCLLAHYRFRPSGLSGGQVRVNLAKPLGDRFSVGTNLGMVWTWATETVDAVKAFEYTVAVGYNVTESLYAYVEGFGESGQWQGDGGLAWRPDPLSQFDVSVGWAGDYGQSYVAVGWSKLMLTGQSGM